jgi:hypothetical protein
MSGKFGDTGQVPIAQANIYQWGIIRLTSRSSSGWT